MWRRRAEPAALVEVIPPRALEESMPAARGMLAALVGERVAFEVLLTVGGPRWYVRAAAAGVLDRAVGQLRGAYPQAVIEERGADPLELAVDEQVVTRTLTPLADVALPLRSDWRRERDPLAGVLAAAQPQRDERVLCRLTLGPARARAADRLRLRQERPASFAGRPATEAPSLVPLVVAMALGVGGLQGWRWYEAGEWLPLLSGGSALLVGVPLGGALVARWRQGREPLPPRTVETKLASPLMAARLEVTAIGRDHRRLAALADQVAAAYAAYDDASGGGLRPSSRAGRTLPLLLGAGEAAALWHLPEAAGSPAGVRRTTARRIAPAPGHATRGVRVGEPVTGGGASPVHLPVPLLHRNHFIVAKTRRGKSTLLRHMAAGLMERVASGAEDTALVVVDPHQDLAEAVLASVPDALADRTIYLDFAHLERPIGLNLLDVVLFPDRDRTTEHVVTMMNRLWPANWGPRMEGALRASLAVLHELNGRRSRVEQFTLLDVAPLLTDRELRARLLDEVEDPALLAWWQDNYDRVGRTLQQQTANPVTSKIGRFTVTEASRLVLGQSRSTFDPRQVLREGGVLVVNTAVGSLGEGAASLVGATMLNLLGLLVEEQVSLPAEQRRRVVELVDESSTLGAVDYPRMLSELGKYGASFTLVTQSLSKLDAIDRELVPTILANSDGITAFQTSAEDARRLLPELGGDLEIEDLVSLDDFTCYARWWDGFARPPAFTLRVDPPPASDLDRARTIAERSAQRHGRPRQQVVDEVVAALTARLTDEHTASETGQGTGDADPIASGQVPAPTGQQEVAVDQPHGKAKAKARGNQQRGEQTGKSS